MNEPKRRGRPPKAKPCPECGQVGSHYDDCGAGMGVLERAVPGAAKALADRIDADLMAQAYAERVWAGQHIFEPRSWRIQRVKEALQGQGLPFEGVELP